MKIRAFAHYAKKLMFFMLFAQCATKQGGIFWRKKGDKRILYSLKIQSLKKMEHLKKIRGSI